MKQRRKTKRGPERRKREFFPPGTMGHYMELYFEWMAIRNYSPNTIKMQKSLLHHFALYTRERGIQKLEEVNRSLVERYQKHLFRFKKSSGKKLSIGAQANRLMAVKSFFSFLCKKHHLIYNPASEIELPKKPKSLPQVVLNQGEMERILASIDLGSDSGVRNRAILEIFYSSGLRRSELCNLDIYDIDFEREVVNVRKGKGGKDRVVPVGKRALSFTRKYLEEVRSDYLFVFDEKALFLSREGTRINGDHVCRMIKNHFKLAGVEKNGGCHLIRHTCATLMLENGADIRFIQEMLGHAKLSTTEVYTRVSIKKLQEVHKATHPAKGEREENLKEGCK